MGLVRRTEPAVEGSPGVVDELRRTRGGPVDLDENGDVSRGTIIIWQVQGEAIETTDSREVDLGGGQVATPVS